MRRWVIKRQDGMYRVEAEEWTSDPDYAELFKSESKAQVHCFYDERPVPVIVSIKEAKK